jgi:hypothetical protein
MEGSSPETTSWGHSPAHSNAGEQQGYLPRDKTAAGDRPGAPIRIGTEAGYLPPQTSMHRPQDVHRQATGNFQSASWTPAMNRGWKRRRTSDPSSQCSVTTPQSISGMIQYPSPGGYRYRSGHVLIHEERKWSVMCNTCGCLNYTLDELVWYHYRCSSCGHAYRSTGQRSVCPVCKSEEVNLVKRQ